MGKLVTFLLVLLFVLGVSCSQQRTPTPSKEVLSPARMAEIEAELRDLRSRIDERVADIKALEASIPRKEMKTGERWEWAVFAKENDIPVSDWTQLGHAPEDTLLTPSPRYLEYRRLLNETSPLFDEQRRLEQLLPPTPPPPTPDIKPRLWDKQVIQIVQKYLRSLTWEEANDLDVGQEWELLQDDWPIRWKTEFNPWWRAWVVQCFEADIVVDDATGEVRDLYSANNDRAHSELGD